MSATVWDQEFFRRHAPDPVTGDQVMAALEFAGQLIASHAWRRIFPRTVRLARRACASDALARGKRAAMRGLNRPAVSWARIALTAAARSCWLVR